MGKWLVIVAPCKGGAPIWIIDDFNKGFDATSHYNALQVAFKDHQQSPSNVVIEETYWFVGVCPFGEKGLFWGDDTIVANSHTGALEILLEAWTLFREKKIDEDSFKNMVSKGHVPANESPYRSLWDSNAVFEKGLAR